MSETVYNILRTNFQIAKLQ